MNSPEYWRTLVCICKYAGIISVITYKISQLTYDKDTLTLQTDRQFIVVQHAVLLYTSRRIKHRYKNIFMFFIKVLKTCFYVFLYFLNVFVLFFNFKNVFVLFNVMFFLFLLNR